VISVWWLCGRRSGRIAGPTRRPNEGGGGGPGTPGGSGGGDGGGGGTEKCACDPDCARPLGGVRGMRRPAWGGSRSPPLKLARTPAPRPCRRASRGHQSNVNRPVHWLRGRHEQEQREEPPSGVPFWGGRPRFRTAITAKCQLPVGMPAHTAHTHSQLLPPPPDHGGPEFKKILCQHQRSSPGLNDALHVSVAFLTAQGRRQLPTARRRCGATSRCHPQLRTSHAVPSDCAVSELVSVGVVAGPVQRSVHPPRAHVVVHTLQLLSHVVLSVASAGVTVTPPLPARPSLVPSLWLSSRGSPPPSRIVM